jgi:hypothetical protein
VSRPSPSVPSQSQCPVPVPASRPSPSVPSQSRRPVPVPASRPSPSVPSQSQRPVPVPASRPSPSVPVSSETAGVRAISCAVIPSREGAGSTTLWVSYLLKECVPTHRPISFHLPRKFAFSKPPYHSRCPSQSPSRSAGRTGFALASRLVERHAGRPRRGANTPSYHPQFNARRPSFHAHVNNFGNFSPQGGATR